MTNNCIREF